jgi:hypothetical protein
MKRFLPLATAALAACATVPAPAVGPTAALGQVARVDGLIVRPLRVVEDSRCPINARCVWAGRMILHARVESTAYDLTLGEPVAIPGGRLTLVAAEPGREAGRETDPAAYRFTFAFER